MNTEDRLWDYIDGTCTSEERAAIEQQLKSDADLKMKLDELIMLHHQLQAVGLDEPSMGFKHRVMEQVLVIPPPTPLKTKVDQRIIYLIASFFILTIVSLLGYTFSQINWGSSQIWQMPQLKFPSMNWSSFINPSYTLFFLSASAVLALVLVDKVVISVREKNAAEDETV